MGIEAVASEAGVSVATVSRAFNRPADVAVATRERVDAAARRLGYQPDASARTLRTRRSLVLGVVLPTLLNPVFAECLEGIAQAADVAGYSIVPMSGAYRLDQEEAAVDRLIARGVDGLVLVVANPAASSTLKRLGTLRIPYVLAYNRHPDHACVSVDGETAVAEVVARLAAVGHRRIAMVSGPANASDRAAQRYAGYLRGMRQARLRRVPLVEVPFVEAAAATLDALLAADGAPTALVCSNDLLAIRCLRAAKRRGMAVPNDLSVVGFDGIAIGAELPTSLSSVAQPNGLIGRRSAETLIAALTSGTAVEAAGSVTLDHSFLIGESIASAPA